MFAQPVGGVPLAVEFHVEDPLAKRVVVGAQTDDGVPGQALVEAVSAAFVGGGTASGADAAARAVAAEGVGYESPARRVIFDAREQVRHRVAHRLAGASQKVGEHGQHCRRWCGGRPVSIDFVCRYDIICAINRGVDVFA